MPDQSKEIEELKSIIHCQLETINNLQKSLERYEVQGIPILKAFIEKVDREAFIKGVSAALSGLGIEDVRQLLKEKK